MGHLESLGSDTFVVSLLPDGNIYSSGTEKGVQFLKENKLEEDFFDACNSSEYGIKI